MVDPKQARIAERIQLIISELLLRHLRDPRLEGITVTEVTIDRELQHANVYVNALGDDARQEDVMAGLESATGYVRREVAQRLDLRSAPHIHFIWDPRLAYIEEVSELLENLDIPPAEPEPEPDDKLE
jgi:ribosome-binding factor A